MSEDERNQKAAEEIIRATDRIVPDGGSRAAPCSASGKRPTRIVTDPREVQRICSKPSTVTHEEAVRSILAQNGKLPPKQNSQARSSERSED